MRRSRVLKALIVLVLAALTLAACGGGDSSKESSGSGTASTKESIEELVRAAFQAESDGDGEAFAALYTDKGLEEYDVGSREELESGEAEGFGEEEVTVIGFTDTEVDGKEGSTTVDALIGDNKVAKPVFRAKFAAVEEDGEWLLDGFEFVGSPPPAAGTPILKIDAADYAFALDKQEVPGNVAFKFSNIGKEPHELSIFKGPAGTDVATAKTALENVNGEDFSNVPAGYEAGHLSFAEAGSPPQDLTFAEPLAAGDYFLVCFIPQGGFTEEREPVNPEGAPHVKLGMINKFTVT